MVELEACIVCAASMIRLFWLRASLRFPLEFCLRNGMVFCWSSTKRRKDPLHSCSSWWVLACVLSNTSSRFIRCNCTMHLFLERVTGVDSFDSAVWTIRTSILSAPVRERPTWASCPLLPHPNSKYASFLPCRRTVDRFAHPSSIRKHGHTSFTHHGQQNTAYSGGLALSLHAANPPQPVYHPSGPSSQQSDPLTNPPNSSRTLRALPERVVHCQPLAEGNERQEMGRFLLQPYHYNT